MEQENFWARYAARQAEDRISAIFHQAAGIAYRGGMHDQGPFMVGGFTVISADRGWEITIKEGERTLVHCAAECDDKGQRLHYKHLTYEGDDGWQARWKQDRAPFKRPTLWNQLTQRLTGGAAPKLLRLPHVNVALDTDQTASPRRPRGGGIKVSIRDLTK